MAIVFSSRAIVDEFKTRNVVFESTASVAKNGDLILRSVVEFADNGCIKRQAIISTDSLHTFSIATEIGKYQADILEIIDGLENFREWLKGDKSVTFSQFVDQESPLFFHGKMTKDKISFSAFGPTLHSLELQCKNTRSLETTPFGERISAIAEHYRKHLKELDAMPINEIINSRLVLQGEVA
jgi:hypothetical protein